MRSESKEVCLVPMFMFVEPHLYLHLTFVHKIEKSLTLDDLANFWWPLSTVILYISFNYDAMLYDRLNITLSPLQMTM